MASSSGAGIEDKQLMQFMSLTGATKEVAEFHLEAAAGKLDVAVEAFYDAGGALARVDDRAAAVQPDGADVLPQGGPPRGVGGVYPTAAGGGSSGGAAPNVGVSNAKTKKKKRPVGNVRGFGDLRNDDGDSDDDDDQQGNEYFTGGERSGMMVQDPKQKKKGAFRSDGDIDRVGGIFDQAQAAGAELGRSEDLPGGARSRMPFSGSSRTLGDGMINPGEEVATESAADIVNTPVLHTITFYRNGFIVNDSNELRRLDDPANAPFLQSIAKGECPRELETAHIGEDGGVNAAINRMRPVTVNLLRRDEDFVPRAAPRYVAFTGTGRTLGSGSDAGNGANGGTASSSSAPTDPASAVTPSVDETQPTTSIQIRLADGTRMIARFNHTHTVGDVRDFIIRSRPGAKVNFAMTTSFPPTPLEDDDKTIAEAGLLNSVVQQKML